MRIIQGARVLLTKQGGGGGKQARLTGHDYYASDQAEQTQDTINYLERVAKAKKNTLLQLNSLARANCDVTKPWA